MRCRRQLLPIALLLAPAACTQLPSGVGSPQPVETLLRVKVFASCLSTPDCGGASATGSYAGPLVFADRDSLVMTDLKAGRRLTIRPGAGVLLEVYRGQHRSPSAAAKGAGKGFLAGIAAGVGQALVSKALGEIVGGGWEVDLDESVRAGVFLGGTVGAVSGAFKGAAEGEAVWERVTLRELRQQLCRCPEPDQPPVVAPGAPLIP